MANGWADVQPASESAKMLTNNLRMSVRLTRQSAAVPTRRNSSWMAQFIRSRALLALRMKPDSLVLGTTNTPIALGAGS